MKATNSRWAKTPDPAVPLRSWRSGSGTPARWPPEAGRRGPGRIYASFWGILDQPSNTAGVDKRGGVNKSSVSTTTRLLVEMDLIERVPSPMPRQVYFQFRPGGWAVFVRERLRLWASLHQIAERGLDLLQDRDPALRGRLQEAHDMFSHVEEGLPTLLERVDARHKR